MQELHKVLINLFRTHRKIVHIEFNKVGLTQGQPKVLDFVASNSGCIQKDIAENCRIEPATVSSLLSLMEKKELLYRSQNSENRRILNVFLTDKGIEAQKQVTEVFNNIDDICFKDFSPEEKMEALRLFTKIQNNLNEKGKIND